MILLKPFNDGLVQPLPCRLPGVVYAHPSKPCRCRGKRSFMVVMFVSLCLASQKPSEREFFVHAGTVGIKLLTSVRCYKRSFKACVGKVKVDTPRSSWSQLEWLRMTWRQTRPITPGQPPIAIQQAHSTTLATGASSWWHAQRGAKGGWRRWGWRGGGFYYPKERNGW